MSEEKINAVVDALKAHFKQTVGESSGMSFEETKVTMPNYKIWREYAIAAIKAIEAYNGT